MHDRGCLLGRCSEVHEHADQREPGVDQHADRDEHTREDVPGSRGHARRREQVAMAFEQRPEHAAPVERERGEQVEDAEDQVEPRDPFEPGAGHEVEREQASPRRQTQDRGGRTEPEAREGSDDRDGKLVSRRLGEALQLRDPTQREQEDLVDVGPAARATKQWASSCTTTLPKTMRSQTRLQTTPSTPGSGAATAKRATSTRNETCTRTSIDAIRATTIDQRCGRFTGFAIRQRYGTGSLRPRGEGPRLVPADERARTGDFRPWAPRRVRRTLDRMVRRRRRRHARVKPARSARG